MARLSDLPPTMAAHIRDLPCPTFETTPWADGPALSRRRVALLSTAGLHPRKAEAFVPGASDYRVLPGDLPASELMMSHISVNFDRTGFDEDVNVVLPVDRLRELVEDGTIGSVGSVHYSVMGATDPRQMEVGAREIARHLKADGVDALVLLPV